LQECAWAHAQENNFGYTFVKKQNALWVLSRIYIKLSKYPIWEDEISIKTWPRPPLDFFAYRDFEISIADEIVGHVCSSWLIIDKKSKRPYRMHDFQIMQSNFIEKSAVDHPLNKLEITSEMKYIEERKVQWSDIDVNGHVNNASYVRWIMDAVFQQNQKQASEFEINFLRELYINDYFKVFLSTSQSQIFATIQSMDGKVICNARAIF
jgi:medium-chain acyl-[acyl-carrier-protein] hydrolase